MAWENLLFLFFFFFFLHLHQIFNLESSIKNPMKRKRLLPAAKPGRSHLIKCHFSKCRTIKLLLRKERSKVISSIPLNWKNSGRLRPLSLSLSLSRFIRTSSPSIDQNWFYSIVKKWFRNISSVFWLGKKKAQELKRITIIVIRVVHKWHHGLKRVGSRIC